MIKYIKPNGTLVIDHYTIGYAKGNLTRNFFRKKIIEKKSEYSLKYCIRLVKILWPIHRFSWFIRKIPLLEDFEIFG